MAEMSADLKFILADRGVAANVQDMLRDNGYLTLSLFAAMVDNRQELRAALHHDYDLDPAAHGLPAPEIIRRRTEVARLVDSWEAATRRVQERDRLAPSSGLQGCR